jgi:hypothetical protein
MGMFVQDLIKPSIRLEEDCCPALVPRIPLGEGDLAPTLETDSGTLPRPAGQAQEPGIEIMVLTRLPYFDTDWRKPISEYLRIRAIPNNKIKNWCLACRAKGYLIHDDELYHRSTSIIL